MNPAPLRAALLVSGRRVIGKSRPLCCEAIEPETATRDHDIPRSRGGLNHPSNIVLACSTCNGAKKDMTGAEFRTFLETGELPESYIRHLTEKRWAMPAMPPARQSAITSSGNEPKPTVRAGHSPRTAISACAKRGFFPLAKAAEPRAANRSAMACFPPVLGRGIMRSAPSRCNRPYRLACAALDDGRGSCLTLIVAAALLAR